MLNFTRPLILLDFNPLKGRMMRDFELIQKLIGKDVTQKDLEFVDCYVQPHLGVFIPFGDGCKYAKRLNHTHPSYMITIYFSEVNEQINPDIEVKDNEYFASILSPEIPHTDDLPGYHYYCILIEPEYFEQAYLKYEPKVPYFQGFSFKMCKDILKTLNTFAFEYSKQMMNAEITLEAQATIITHWIVRSILGETYDMRAISSDYVVARAQHFIEQHFMEEITTKKLAELGNMSLSSFNRIFKKETKLTPIEYLIEVRLNHAKKLLRRREIPITEVALKCGFNSSSHLAASFQRVLHMTPSAYRNLYVE